MVKVPGSTQIISRLEADEIVRVLGWLVLLEFGPLFELVELLSELLEFWVWESDSEEATELTHWLVCLK